MQRPKMSIINNCHSRQTFTHRQPSISFSNFNAQDEWRYLISGGTIKSMRDNPAPTWLYERAWNDILALTNLHNFSSFADDFVANLSGFRTIFDSAEPHR